MISRQGTMWLFFFLTWINISCKDSETTVGSWPPHFPPFPAYVPGQVIVIFADSVNAPFIYAFISGLGLVPLTVTADSAFTVWVQVGSGDVNTYIARLEQDSAVSWAVESGYPFEDGDSLKTYILVRFKGTVNFDYARALVHAIPGLSWKRAISFGRLATIGVPVGEEQAWIVRLRQYPFVRSAEQNAILHIND